MDAPCKIQGSIHVFRLVNNMCPGKWVHIKILRSLFILLFIFYNYLTVYVVPRPIPCFLKKPDLTNLFKFCSMTGKTILIEFSEYTIS